MALHRTPPGTGLTTQGTDTRSIETRTSWVVAGISLALLGFSFGGPWITAVGLKAIAEEMGGARSVPALASSLAWFGSAVGGILMGRIAERIGIRWTVMFGSVMICIGLFISTGGRAVAALCRARPVHGPAGQCRAQCAALRLCQPLVRPAARLGAGVDFERRLPRRLRLADHLRARHRQLRLALDHDRLRGVSGRDHRPGGGGVPARRHPRPPQL